MSETHLNAYYGAVAEAEEKVAKAQSELGRAKRQLREKLQADGRPVPKELEEPKPEKPKEDDKPGHADTAPKKEDSAEGEKVEVKRKEKK